MFRSVLFHACYYAASTFFVVTAMPLLALPSRAPLARWIGLYARTMVGLMRRVGGIALTRRGQEQMPSGPVILAAKHQSWGDGFATFAAVPDLAFVCGDHLTDYPLLGGILKKLGAIVVDNCGGAAARGRLVSSEMSRAKAEGRSILIYPEGHLAPAGQQHRYRKGIWHMYHAMNVPVVPIATDLGLRWPQREVALRPGPCTVEFLPAIEPGLPKEEFMARLEADIETASLALITTQRAAGTLPDGWVMPTERIAAAPARQSARAEAYPA